MKKSGRIDIPYRPSAEPRDAKTGGGHPRSVGEAQTLKRLLDNNNQSIGIAHIGWLVRPSVGTVHRWQKEREP